MFVIVSQDEFLLRLKQKLFFYWWLKCHMVNSHHKSLVALFQTPNFKPVSFVFVLFVFFLRSISDAGSVALCSLALFSPVFVNEF